ncbi:thioester reductase domain-containing protein [Pendulispora brunnea]|uniref:Thioester reductase domain-containing protein n=1 Tax=Pendulispora brunnea TaxID=2905690 RepID=A0ABZ2JYE4_9BACT
MPDTVLTGATGFLGGYLAAELLRQTQATVHCLIRGHTEAGAARRLRDHMAGHGLSADSLKRLVVVHGDITQPRLGLSDTAYDRLAIASDSIYHCAATLNLAAEYEWLAPTNIEGTRTLLEFAKHRKPKTIHHVSSLGVFVGARAAGFSEVDETTPASLETTAGIGYCRTKLDSETLVRGAGLPVVIYRPGLILGDTRAGTSSERDILVRLLRAAVAVGIVPRTTGQLWVGPVDGVARALVALSKQEGVIGQTFHLTNDVPFAIQCALDRLLELGYGLIEEPASRWRSTLIENIGDSNAFAMAAVWRVGAYLLEETPAHRMPIFRCDATSAALRRLGMTVPRADDVLLDRMIDYLVKRRWLPPAGTERRVPIASRRQSGMDVTTEHARARSR